MFGMFVSDNHLINYHFITLSAYYRLSEDGRRVATEQREKLTRALHHACQLRNESLLNPNDDDVGERFGNVIMALNYIVVG